MTNDEKELMQDLINQASNKVELLQKTVIEKDAEIERLKAEVKQAKIDVLKNIWSRISNKKSLIQSYIADGSFTIEDIYAEIDELIAEVEKQ